MTKPQTDRYLVKIQGSGDTFVIEADEDGSVYAESIALHVEDWSDDGGYSVKPDLELYDFHLEQLDEPESDDKYAYLTF